MSGSVQIVSYNFATIENPLSDAGNFTAAADSSLTGALQAIAGNLCEPATTDADAGSLYTGHAWPNNQYVELTLAAFSGSVNSRVFLMLRSAGASSGNYYLAQLDFGGVNQVQILKAVGGSQSNVGSAIGITPAVNDVWRFAVEGSTLTVYQNGVLIVSATDGTYASGTVGFALVAATAVTNAQVKLFAAGAITPAAPTISPNGGAFPVTVTLTSDAGSTIYYTKDGTTPTSSSPSVASGGTVSINHALNLKANASFDATNFSGIASVQFVVTSANFVNSPFNPSMALLGGWPYVQTAGDGNLGNDAANESNAVTQPTGSAATDLSGSQAQNTSAGGEGGRSI